MRAPLTIHKNGNKRKRERGRETVMISVSSSDWEGRDQQAPFLMVLKEKGRKRAQGQTIEKRKGKDRRRGRQDVIPILHPEKRRPTQLFNSSGAEKKSTQSKRRKIGPKSRLGKKEGEQEATIPATAGKRGQKGGRILLLRGEAGGEKKGPPTFRID